MTTLLDFRFGSATIAPGVGNRTMTDGTYTLDVIEPDATPVASLEGGRLKLVGPTTDYYGVRGQTLYDHTVDLTVVADLSVVWSAVGDHNVIVGWHDNFAPASLLRAANGVGFADFGLASRRRHIGIVLLGSFGSPIQRAPYSEWYPLDDTPVRIAIRCVAGGAWFYGQGGCFRDVGCEAGSDDWYLFWRSTTAVNGIRPYVAVKRGTAYVSGLQVISGWSPAGSRSSQLDFASGKFGVHMATAAMCRDTAGDTVMVAAWQNGSDHSATDTVIMASRCVGESAGWSPPAMVRAAAGGGDIVGRLQPQLLKLSDQRLWLSYGYTTAAGTAGWRYKESLDQGLSWGAEQVFPAPPEAQLLGFVTIMPSGRWIVAGGSTPLSYEVGPSKSVSSLTRSGTTATAKIAGHGYLAGDLVSIAGAAQGEYNLTRAHIINVGADNFDYTITGSPATPATGTITATKEYLYRDPAIWYSDDQGAHWTMVALARPVLCYPSEGFVVTERDGTLSCWWRSSRGRLYRNSSADGGATWTAIRPTALPNNNSRTQVARLSDGRLMIVGNDSPGFAGPDGVTSGTALRNRGTLWLMNEDMVRASTAWCFADYGSYFDAQYPMDSTWVHYPVALEWAGSEHVHLFWSECRDNHAQGHVFSAIQYRRVSRRLLPPASRPRIKVAKAR